MVTITIIVTEVNEPPAITGTADIDVEENGNISLPDRVYTATDRDVDTAGTEMTWSLSGPDAGMFDEAKIEDTHDLQFKAQPDYEMPGDANGDNTYEVTVVVADSDGNRGTKDVKVKVTNIEEAGTVALSRTQPRVGVPVTASLTDPDGSISGLRWQWYRDDNLGTDNLPTTECADATSDMCVIKRARSDTYVPTSGDEMDTLTAVATYTDGFGPDTATMTSAAVAEDTRNKAPVFVDQDTEMDGDQNESATRDVEENAEAMAAVGSPVMARTLTPTRTR